MLDEILIPIDANVFPYLKKIIDAGANYRLKAFCKLPEAVQGNIFCNVFAKKFVDICREKVKIGDIEFVRNREIIHVIKPVRFIVTGEARKTGEKISKTIHIDSTLLKLVDPHYNPKFNLLVYTMDMNQEEYDVDVLIKRFCKVEDNFSEFANYKINVHPDDAKLLAETYELNYWKTILPSKYQSTEKSLLVDFIDVLHERDLIDAMGNEIVDLVKIYHAAMKVFPEFAKLPIKEKVAIMDKSCSRGYAIARSSRDEHLFSKATFEVIAEKGLHRVVFANAKSYTLHTEYVDTIEGKKRIRMLRYEYEVKYGGTVTTCFHPFDLWHLLAVGEKNGFSTMDESVA